MESQDGPDKVQVSRYANGALIAVGLPWDSGLLVQEYWHDDRPYYSVANTSNQPVRVGVSEWNRGVGRPLVGPWTIPANGVACHPVEELLTNYLGSLVAILLNEQPLRGLLKRPRAFTRPHGWAVREDILTVDGLNGVGDRDANLIFLQERNRFRARTTSSLKLRVPAGLGTIHFQDSFKPPENLPQVCILEAASETLPVEYANQSHVIHSPEASPLDSGDVTLTVQLPAVSSETMAVLIGRVVNPDGAGFSFARGLIVSNED